MRVPGEIVTKDALYEAGWPGLAVEESNLTVQVSQIRRILSAEAPGGRDWVETLARRGYRFVGPAFWEDTAPSVRPATKVISNIPVTVPLHFTGRVAALGLLDAVLTELAHRPAIAALHGLRGVGKTMLAAAYARQHEADYRAIWWLRAATVPTLRADLAALAVRMGWAGPNVAEHAALDAALQGMQDDGERLLLIYDNAIDAASLRGYLPKAGAARIIVTSNAPAWRAYATPLELAVWPAAVGADYLIARTGRTDQRNDAETLSTALGGLPLAHEQAGAYIENLELSFAEYRRRLEAAPVRLLDDPAHAPPDYHDGLTVAKAFHLAIAQAAFLHPACETLLRYAALLAPEPIPVFLFREACGAFGEKLATQLADNGLDGVLAALRSFALISREAIPDERDPELRTDCLRLHRLVRQVAAERMPAAAVAPSRAALIEGLTAVYPAGVFGNPATWPRARRLDALALPLVAQPAAIPDGAEASASILLDGLASYRHGALGAFAQALPLFERANVLAEAHAGPGHPFTAQTLNNLGLLLRDRGELAAARPLHARALAIREAAFGPDHYDVSISLNNLALVMARQDDDASARPLLERALAIRMSLFGENHELTAQSITNLGWLLNRLGEPTRAEALHRKALELREALLGSHHPGIANSLNNIVLVLLGAGKPDEARALGERAVGIAEAAIGPDHVETVSMRVNLARAILAQGDPAAALPLAERALAILSAALARGSPSLRTAAGANADCLDALGRPDEANDIRTRYEI